MRSYRVLVECTETHSKSLWEILPCYYNGYEVRIEKKNVPTDVLSRKLQGVCGILLLNHVQNTYEKKKTSL